MNTSQTTRRHSAEWHAQQAQGSWDTAAKYRKLAEMAEQMSKGNDPMADEARRLHTIADEFDGDAEENAEQAIAKGYQP